MSKRKPSLKNCFLQIGVAISIAATCFAAFSAEPMAAEQRHVGEHASVISEQKVVVNGKPMLEVVVNVWKSGEVVRFIQPVSHVTQGSGSRVVINLEDGKPCAVNWD